MSNGKKLYATSTAPYHMVGELLNVSESIAAKMLANGWAEYENTEPIKEVKTEVKKENKKLK